MKTFNSIISNGLTIIAPIFITFLLLYWIFVGLENFFQWLLLLFIDPSHYFIGMGWLAAFLMTVLVGLIAKLPVLHKVVDKMQSYVFKLPVIKSVYRTFSDLMSLFSKKGIKQGKVVKISTSMGNILGIMTQDQLDQLPEGVGDESEVAVFVPMSYQLGGFTFIIPKESIEPIEMSVQKALTLTLSAYMSGKKNIR